MLTDKSIIEYGLPKTDPVTRKSVSGEIRDLYLNWERRYGLDSLGDEERNERLELLLRKSGCVAQEVLWENNARVEEVCGEIAAIFNE
ncbi:hypothetical protein A2125_02075 [Candidatus Woesebacteria bacterium GWB1_43_5]|uniref:Uncharacterized protein n=1 Tax=Candidatus Woesebacteria bacterium GWB1_43_5 TaxID=1802474 RepID=A0A1F7WRF8_9BACT|nr:MAG: hypothetical protein A2125_02075 [Candidatus Woesebacteria bacterium GWB1_43_5]